MQRLRSLVLPLLLVLAHVAARESPSSGEPTFKVDARDLPASPVLVIYGDTRFTNFRFPRSATSPWARHALIQKIASEKPDALFITGDLPFRGAQISDYEVFQRETTIWQDARLRIYPALGNHEFYNRDFLPNRERGLANWWKVFPFLAGRRWYSLQFGRQIYALFLDSNFGALKKGGAQRLWIDRQLAGLPDSVNYVFFVLHHAPIGDYMEGHAHAHAPEMTADDFDAYLERKQQHVRARFIVTSGHVHNYGRFERNGVTYLITGGGAHPVFFHRQADDKFKGKDLMRAGAPLPNYHYLKFELGSDSFKVTMVRIENPWSGDRDVKWDAPEKFRIAAPSR